MIPRTSSQSCFRIIALVHILASLTYFLTLTNQLPPGHSDLARQKDVILADSLLYSGNNTHSIKIERLTILDIRDQLQSSPSVLPMTAFAYGLGQLGIPAIVFNTVLTLGAAWILLNISSSIQSGFPSMTMLTILLNPITIYYSQSFTKEIILLFAMALMIWSYLNRRLVILFGTLAFVGWTRVYFLLPVLAFFVIQWLKKRSTLLNGKSGMISFYVLYASGLAYAYSLSSRLKAPATGWIASGGGPGLSNLYAQILDIPFVPLLFLPIRLIQIALEPLLALPLTAPSSLQSLGFVAASGCGMIHLVLLLLLIRRSKVFGAQSWRLESTHPGTERLVPFIVHVPLLTFITVSLLPFIQMRYIFPVMPLVALLTSLLPSLMKAIESHRKAVPHNSQANS